MARAFAEHQPTPCSISRRKRTSTGRSTARAPSSTPTSSAPSCCSRPRGAFVGGLPPAARDAFRFLHVSTDEVYGSLGRDGVSSARRRRTRRTRRTPRARPAPIISCARMPTPTACRSLITNCSNNYGPFQFPEKLIPLMILNALDGRPLPIYGDGGNVRDWLHVEDHCAGILLVLDEGTRRRKVQCRRRQRAHQPRDRRSDLRRARRSCVLRSRRSRRALEDVRARSSRPRSPLRDRRHEDPPRARLDAAPHVRERPARDRPLVPRAPRLVRAGAGRAVRSRAAGTRMTDRANPDARKASLRLACRGVIAAC